MRGWRRGKGGALVEMILVLPLWLLILFGGLNLFRGATSSMRKQERIARKAAGDPPAPEFREVSWPGAQEDK